MTDYEIELLASMRLLVAEVEGERSPQSPDIVAALAAVNFHLEKGPRLAPENFVRATPAPQCVLPAGEWIKNTGKKPVADDVRVAVSFVDGDFDCEPAERFDWGIEDDGSDIAAYFVIPPAPTPVKEGADL